MALKNDSINVEIFGALKVSELSGVPLLLMSNPGVGKSTSVSLFAEVRGYHLLLLRGNSTTETEVAGYDVADVTEGSKTTKHLRPSWFTELLEMRDKGVKTLLFLDEITTANEYVQAALLHLIFDRMCGDEKLPDDTLIVSAGNYSQNLSNQMTLLPPLMNRFMIFNITPEIGDLDTFLCKYKGSLAGIRKTNDPYNISELKTLMSDIDKQEVKYDEDQLGKIGEYIENGIKSVTERCIKEKKIDLAEKELQGIYSDVSHIDKLCGFVTFRTLNYLRDSSIAMYSCFGKEGIASDNFRNMIDGLCGIGVSRGQNGGDIKTTYIGSDYQTMLLMVANDLEKLKNTKLPEYEKFFTDVLTRAKSNFQVSDLQILINKITELKKDDEIKSIDRPIGQDTIESLCKKISSSCKAVIKLDYSFSTDAFLEDIGEENLINLITFWNTSVELCTLLSSLINDKTKNYDENAKTVFVKFLGNLDTVGFKVRSFHKIAIESSPAIGNILPEVKSFKKTK